ncbi:MAG: plasmid pRiA4b ORF-3 family protein, partial [Steroidobacteraceae bacterium]
MTPPQRSSRTKPPLQPPPEENGVVQLKVWLLGISPMIWGRLLVPSTCTLRELHGVIQVAMGWEGFHLYQFCLRAAHYGSWELSASSPEVTLAAPRLRKGARFTYEYDLNIPWRHEVRIEDHIAAEPGKTYPRCTGGGGACPPEDCGGPEGYLAGLDEAMSMEAFEDLDSLIEIIDQVVLEGRAELLKDEETRWHLEQALERIEDREHAPGEPFSRRAVNARLR